MEMIGQRQSRKLPPHKPLLWQVTHSESACVFFHMYAASNKCFYLFHNFGLFAEFFLQRRQESRFFFSSNLLLSKSIYQIYCWAAPEGLKTL